ncbi:hypothetical protein N7491_004287 [Penicillium cf. griseofulvum]|nr:hypothetical protein N7445_011195 [Penicillium cf. griseofulvum]KAJ5433692.1 hypothetical protein N7491_004287 [Penicillium cf. griseofulvum]
MYPDKIEHIYSEAGVKLLRFLFTKLKASLSGVIGNPTRKIHSKDLITSSNGVLMLLERGRKARRENFDTLA